MYSLDIFWGNATLTGFFFLVCQPYAKNRWYLGVGGGWKSRSEVRLRDLLFHCSAQQNAIFGKKFNSNGLSRSKVLYLMTNSKKKLIQIRKKNVINYVILEY